MPRPSAANNDGSLTAGGDRLGIHIPHSLSGMEVVFLLELHYEMTEQAYRAGIEAHLARRRWQSVPGWLMLAVSLFSLIEVLWVASSLWTKGVLFVLFIFALVIGLLFFSPRYRAGAICRNAANRRRLPTGFFGPRTLKLADDGLYLNYAGQGANERKLTYAQIVRAEAQADCTLLYFAPNGELEIVPGAAFADEAARQLFLDRLAALRQAATAQQTSGQPQTQAVPASIPQDAQYVLRFDWDKAGLLDALVQVNRRMRKGGRFWGARRIVCILVGIFSLCMIGLSIIMMPGLLWTMLLIMYLFIALLSLAPLIMQHPALLRRGYQNMLARDRSGMVGPQICALTPAGVYIARLNEERLTPWSDINWLDDNGTLLSMLTRTNRVILLPSSAFASREERSQVFAYMRNNIKK